MSASLNLVTGEIVPVKPVERQAESVQIDVGGAPRLVGFGA
jgi:hypothetical protein